MKTETMIVKEICDWLFSNCSAESFTFWRSNNIPVFGRALPKYTPRGLPDIIVVIKGRIVALEVKRPGSDTDRELNGRKVRPGVLSSDQKIFSTALSIAGGLYYLVTSLDQAKDSIASAKHLIEKRA